MLTYRDMTFCVNEQCKKRCSRFLTPDIEEKARMFGLPIAMANMICLDCGEDGKYEYKNEDSNERLDRKQE